MGGGWLAWLGKAGAQGCGRGPLKGAAPAPSPHPAKCLSQIISFRFVLLTWRACTCKRRHAHMFGLVYGLFQQALAKRDHYVLILGLDNAGKTVPQK